VWLEVKSFRPQSSLLRLTVFRWDQAHLEWYDCRHKQFHILIWEICNGFRAARLLCDTSHGESKKVSCSQAFVYICSLPYMKGNYRAAVQYGQRRKRPQWLLCLFPWWLYLDFHHQPYCKQVFKLKIINGNNYKQAKLKHILKLYKQCT
jgi:hypothetical protein